MLRRITEFICLIDKSGISHEATFCTKCSLDFLSYLTYDEYKKIDHIFRFYSGSSVSKFRSHLPSFCFFSVPKLRCKTDRPFCFYNKNQFSGYQLMNIIRYAGVNDIYLVKIFRQLNVQTISLSIFVNVYVDKYWVALYYFLWKKSLWLSTNTPAWIKCYKILNYLIG